MYEVYDSIYCLLDAKLKSEKYTFSECQVIQYEFGKSLSRLVVVDNSLYGTRTLKIPNRFTVDELSLTNGLNFDI